MTNVSAGTQDMVQAVKQRNPNLKFTSQSWAKRKGLAGGLDYNLWEPGSAKQNENWHLMVSQMPRTFRASGGAAEPAGQPS